MKTFPAALVCVLLISGAAFAQNEPNREHPRHGATGDRNVPPERPGRDSGPGSMNGQPGPESRPGNGMMHQDNGPMGAMGQDRNGMRGNSVQHNHDRLRGDRARIDRNLDRFRGNVETGHRFHGGRWNPPQGYTPIVAGATASGCRRIISRAISGSPALGSMA